MVLAIFGDIDPAQTMELLESSFGRVPKADDFQFPKYPTEHAATEGSLVHLPIRKENTAMVIIGFPTVTAMDVETRSKLEVLNSIMTGGGGIGGRLFQELRGERLVYYVFGQEMSGPAPGYFYFMAQTRPDTLQEVIRRIQANLSKVAKEGVPQEEFDLAKQKLIAGHSMQNVTPQAQAFQAAVDELLGLGYDHDRTYDERINRVRIEDVRDVVRQYFQRAIIATSSPSSADIPAVGERAARRK
jgi:zinc protease